MGFYADGYQIRFNFINKGLGLRVKSVVIKHAEVLRYGLIKQNIIYSPEHALGLKLER